MSYIVKSFGQKKDAHFDYRTGFSRLPTKVVGEYHTLKKAKAACRHHRNTAWKTKEKLVYRYWSWGREYESNRFEYRGAYFWLKIEKK